MYLEDTLYVWRNFITNTHNTVMEILYFAFLKSDLNNERK